LIKFLQTDPKKPKVKVAVLAAYNQSLPYACKSIFIPTSFK